MLPPPPVASYGDRVTLRAALTNLHDRVKRTAPGYMLVVALAIGLLAGYGAVGVRYLIEGLELGVWGRSPVALDWLRGQAWYVIVAIPAAGGLIVGCITHFFAKEAKGHGVPEVMEAVALRGGVIRPRVVVAKALASGVTIASGGSVGREGPVVQIGAAIGSTLGQFLKVGQRRMRTLVGCGAAAGIAATFNAPVAGALFAVEVILGDFGVPQFSPIVISSVAATVVSHHYLGNLPAFEIPRYHLAHPAELLAYAALGLLAGLLAVVFSRALAFAEDRNDALGWPLPITTCLGGAAVGALALLVPGVLGVGYESMSAALTGSPTAALLFALLGAKLVAVCITLGSGGSGGVFAPSLFLGATLGALVGLGVSTLFPGSTTPTGAYALVGMGALVAAATHAPITAILIIFELTNDYRIMLPLMTCCIVATQFAARLDKQSIYTIKLARRGIDVRSGQDVNLLRNIPVREVLSKAEPTRVPTTERLGRLIETLTQGDAACLYVVDEAQHLTGVLSMRELRPLLHDAELLANLVVADELTEAEFPSVRTGDTLDMVLTALDLGYRDELPVLAADDTLVGTVHIADVLARYRKELEKRQLAASATA